MSDAPKEPLNTWPPADLDAFEEACLKLRLDKDMDTGRMGIVCALARLQDRILELERRLSIRVHP